MRIRVNRGRCRGAGQCALNAPELFDQSEDDGLVVVLDDQPPPALHDRARLAERLCPNSVIRTVDTNEENEENDENEENEENDENDAGEGDAGDGLAPPP